MRLKWRRAAKTTCLFYAIGEKEHFLFFLNRITKEERLGFYKC